MRRLVRALVLVVGFVAAVSAQPARAANGPSQFVKMLVCGLAPAK